MQTFTVAGRYKWVYCECWK